MDVMLYIPLTFKEISERAHLDERGRVSFYESEDGCLVIYPDNTDYVIVVDEIDGGVVDTYSIYAEVSEGLLPFNWIRK